ncbi:MAG: RNA-binding domain-containing protein [Candidatus Woesearchaeota archaeon]
MNKKEILKLLEQPESHNLELKETLHSEQKISQTICSFANTDGGILIIGVDNKRSIVGFKEDPDQTQQRLSACNQSISPAPLINIELHYFDKNPVILVIIHKADTTNFHTYKGIIYVRIGSTVRKLEGHTMVEFLKNKQILCFDELSNKAKPEDLDKDKINKYLALRNQKDYLNSHTINEFLLSMNLATENGSLNIKNATVLSFSKNPKFWFYQSEVKVVKFSGIEAINVVAHQVLEGSPSELIESIYAFVLKNISKEIKVEKNLPKRDEIFEYPLDVIREAIINAIAHRDYFNNNSIQVSIFDDRIEIINPGSIPSGLTKELFGKLSVQRNPITYRILKDMKYIEGLGIGIPKMINGMRKGGLSDPDFFWTDSFFRLTLKNIKSKITPINKLDDLNKRQLRSIEYLRQNKTIKTKNYASMNSISESMALHDLAELIQFGYIKKIGQYRGAYYILNEAKFR